MTPVRKMFVVTFRGGEERRSDIVVGEISRLFSKITDNKWPLIM